MSRRRSVRGLALLLCATGLLALGVARPGAAVEDGRTVRLEDATIPRGGSGEVPVVLVSEGDEQSLRFSISFEEDLLIFDSVEAGADAADASVLVASGGGTVAIPGTAGLAISLPPGQTFAAGDNEVALLHFRAVAGTETETFTMSLIDTPTTREIRDVNGNLLEATWDNATVTVEGSAECALSCDPAAEPSEGVEPLTVSFAANATVAGSCSGSPSYQWSFGDGEQGSGADTTHTYAAAGSFTWQLEVTVDDESCSGSGTVEVESSGQAPVASFEWVQVSSTPGAFEVQFTDTSTGSPTGWQWDFGDGGQGTDQHPSHTYLEQGRYTVTLTATNQHGEDTVGLAVEVVGQEPTMTWLAVVVSAAGAEGTFWQSDVAILNRQATAAEVDLVFHAGGVDTPPVAHLRVDPAQQILVPNIVGEMFGMSPASGALQLLSSQPVTITSRTYNLAGAEGTYGQFIDGYQGHEGLRAGEAARLLLVQHTESFRTNIGFTNTGAEPADLRCELFSSDGGLRGFITPHVEPGQWLQLPLSEFVEGRLEGTVRVDVQSGTGILAYASVVDNLSGDPTLIPAETDAGLLHWIAVAAHTEGVAGSFWMSDLAIFNRSLDVAQVELTLHTDGDPRHGMAEIGPGQQAFFPDIVGQLGYQGSGALELRSTQLVAAISRIYNWSPAGTYGQFMDGYRLQDAVSTGETVWLQQLAENPGFRTNIGMTNIGPSPAQVELVLFDRTGAVVGVGNHELAPAQVKQLGRPYHVYGRDDIVAGYAQVTLVSGERVIAYASVVDNITSDPTTIPAKR